MIPRGLEVQWLIDLLARCPQDNIQDKMRRIPFEVSAEVINARRHKSRSGLPQLLPILDQANSRPAVKMVNSQRVEGCTITAGTQGPRCVLPVVAGGLCERGLWPRQRVPQ